VSTGFRQGDALSPALFNIALESVVRQVLSKADGLKFSDDQQLTIIAYADDLVIITENEESLKQSTKELIRAGKEIGLNINEDKTKYLIHNRAIVRIDVRPVQLISGHRYTLLY